MRKVILLAVIFFSAVSGKAQITYEHTYPGPNSPAQTRPIIINMGGYDGYK